MYRQRIIDSISHRQTAIVPWNIELTNGAAANIKAYAGCSDVEKYLENHMMREKYKKNTPLDNGLETDLFGVTWQKSDDGGDVGNIVDHPLKEDDLAGYAFPRPMPEFADRICDRLENNSRGRFTMFSITMGYFERAWSLRGMENCLVDMCLNETFTRALLDGILQHHLSLLDHVLGRNFDAVYIGDDWGQQQGLIMGPDMWRKYIKPGIAQIYAKIKSKGKFIVQHSCGDIKEILPDLIDMGLDVYNTIQPEIYDIAWLKREYGKDLTFYGGISTQRFLPFASADEVKNKTGSVLDVLFRDGGYILSPTHAVTPDIPAENILAMIEAAKAYGGN